MSKVFRINREGGSQEVVEPTESSETTEPVDEGLKKFESQDEINKAQRKLIGVRGATSAPDAKRILFKD